MIGYSSHSAGCALTQSIPSAPAVCNHRSSYRQAHLKRYVGFTFSCRLPIDNIRFGQPETPMYLRPFLSHRTVPFRSTRSSRSAFSFCRRRPWWESGKPADRWVLQIMVRPTGFEPAAFRVGVIRPSSRKALRRKGLVEIAQISAILKKNLRSLSRQDFRDFSR